MSKKIIERFTAVSGKLFFDGLKRKTGWGRNEVKDLFSFTQLRAMSEIFDEVLDETEKKEITHNDILYFVTIHTNERIDMYPNKEPRNVTLSYNREYKAVYLLGGLEHNTQITVDQELVDHLQYIVNEMEK